MQDSGFRVQKSVLDVLNITLTPLKNGYVWDFRAELVEYKFLSSLQCIPLILN